MPKRNTWRPGSHLVECERTGFTFYDDEVSPEWTGHIVNHGSWEMRHPQDFVRGIQDKQSVWQARPAGGSDGVPATFIGPLATSLATEGVTGNTVLTVASDGGFFSGDTVRVVLDCGSHQTTIATEGVPSGTLTLASPLTGVAARGNSVTDLSRITTATGGY